MGIKDLHTLLKKVCPNYSKQRSLKDYAFKKVAIDISLYLYKYKALAKSNFSLPPDQDQTPITNHWIGMFLDLICCLRASDIHPLFVYDGQAPADKLIEQQRRRSSVLTQKSKIEQLEKDLEQYLIDPTIIPTSLEKYTKPISLFHPSRVCISVELVREKILKMKSMVDLSPTRDDLVLTKQLFDLLGIPHITPNDEAERYASHLCVLGKVDAVLSEDTDVMAYGTPTFLTKIDVRNGTVFSIDNDLLLEEIGMIPSQFTDMCILLGCDYNSNIYGYGWNKTYKLIKEHPSIEEVLETIQKDQKGTSSIVDLSVIRYERCRELFKIPTSINYYPPYCEVINDFSKVDEFLHIHNLRYSIDKIKRSLGPRDLSHLIC